MNKIKTSYRNYQSLKIVGLILRIIVIGKLKDKSEALASCDAQVDICRVEQASQ